MIHIHYKVHMPSVIATTALIYPLLISVCVVLSRQVSHMSSVVLRAKTIGSCTSVKKRRLDVLIISLNHRLRSPDTFTMSCVMPWIITAVRCRL